MNPPRSRSGRPTGLVGAFLLATLLGWLRLPAETASTAAPSPSVAEIAAAYTNFIRMTPEVVFVDPELAMRCRGVSPEESAAARALHGPHALAGVLIHMNDLAAAAFRTNTTVYPVGAVVVKRKTVHGDLHGDGTSAVAGNGVGGMVKRPPGFDPDHGDWEYFHFDDPKRIESGRIPSCVQCHASAKDRDHVFGTWKRAAEKASGSKVR